MHIDPIKEPIGPVTTTAKRFKYGLFQGIQQEANLWRSKEDKSQDMQVSRLADYDWSWRLIRECQVAEI